MSQNEFAERHATYKRQIDEAIASYFGSRPAKAGLVLAAHEQEALEHLREFSLRPAKRLRGSLVLLAYASLAGRKPEEVIGAAVAMELIQSYLLIIDDVMDQSRSRRGKPTIHKIYQAKVGGPKHLADMLAINVGLLASHLASGLISELKLESARLNNAQKILHQNIIKTIYGQIDDLYNDQISAGEEADILRITEFKASYYTYIGPLMLGAALAGKLDTKVAASIEEFGRPAGMTFQLHDDVLSLFGAEQQTGKPNLDDLSEGKMTLLIYYALQLADKEQVRQVKAALGNQALTELEAQAIRQIIEACGARAQVEQAVQKYAAQAQKALASSNLWDNKSQQFLSELIKYSVSRKV